MKLNPLCDGFFFSLYGKFISDKYKLLYLITPVAFNNV